MAPANGTVSFRAKADDLFRFTVDGIVVVDTVSGGGDVSTSLLTWEVEMVEVRNKATACVTNIFPVTHKESTPQIKE